jgi:hypothetical protein
MDFGRVINLSWKALMLDRQAMKDLAVEPSGVLATLLLFVIGGALSGGFAICVSPFLIVAGILGTPIVSVLVIGIYHLIALAMGGKGQFVPYLQSVGSPAGLLGWFSVIPVLGWIVQLWVIPVAVLVTEQEHQLDRMRATLVVLLPTVLLLLCCCAVGILSWGSISTAQEFGPWFERFGRD